MVRTRFAPSPTGELHIGGLRTALFNFLLAKQHHGTFFLRIEDTDRERHVENATENLLKILEWAGVTPSEGVLLKGRTITQDGNYGPYIQSERLPLYQDHAKLLMEKGHAYRCFCTRERLDEMRKQQQTKKQAPMYDRACVHISKEEAEKRAKTEPHVVRFLVPRGETVEHEDAIRGKVTFSTNTIDDQVLLKSDGFPTYHLAHVVDDHLMGTTDVIRGEEWLPSLPKHLLLFRAFGWKAPRYAHVPLLLSPQGGKLSKRDGDVSAGTFIQAGYLPEALINFVALLGWNPGTEQEIFTMKELIETFSLERVQKGGAIFETKKLDWLQGQWMRKMPTEEFANRIRPLVQAAHPQAADDTAFLQKAQLIQERITFFHEAPEMLGYFYEKPIVTMELLASKKQKVAKEMIPKILHAIIGALESIEEKDWNETTIAEHLSETATRSGYKRGQILWPLRAALTGREFSPGAFEVATVLGKTETMKRLSNCATLTPNP